MSIVFKRFLRRTVLFIMTALLLQGLVAETGGQVMATAAAKAKSLPAGVVKAWNNPVSKSIYTGPGNKVFFNTLKQALKAIPKGDTVRVSTYYVSDKSMIKAFISAKKRGVNVRFTTSTKAAKANPGLFKKLKKALGTDTRKPSYLKLCKGSCYLKGKDSAAQHAKVVLISRVINGQGKTVRNISFITSANLSKATVTRTWNHSQLIVGCPKIYQALASYIDGMKYDVTRRNFKPVAACGYKLYLYPSTQVVNPVYPALQKTACKVTKTSKTVVRVMMWIWTGSERKIAKQLVALKKRGCDVAVIISLKTTNKNIVKRLKKGGVTVYNAQLKDRYLHAKVVALKGRIGKKPANFVWSGSANFTYAAMAKNTDTMLRTQGVANVKSAFTFFDIVAKHSRKL